MSIFVFVMALLLGALVGGFITAVINRQPCSGYLRVDKSDPDGPYLFLELQESVHELEKREYAYLRIKNESFLPQD